jgi:DNA-binding response OmpR family regulator
MARILLIEPNIVLASQYTAYLLGKGHDILSGQTAQAAVTLADQTSPQLVVLELQLPAHSGIEFLHEFRSYAEWKEIPVIVLTQLHRQDVPASDSVLNGLGVKKFLHKSDTDLKKLAHCIEAVLAEQPPKTRQT